MHFAYQHPHFVHQNPVYSDLYNIAPSIHYMKFLKGVQRFHAKEIQMRSKKKTKGKKKKRVECVSNLIHTDRKPLIPMFTMMPDELKMTVMSFLSKSDLQVLMCTSKNNLVLCRSEHLWLQFCQDKWGIMKAFFNSPTRTKTDFDRMNRFQLQDKCHIPIIPTLPRRRNKMIENAIRHVRKEKPPKNTINNEHDIDLDNICPNHINYSVLLRLTKDYPVNVDDAFIFSKENETAEFRQYSMMYAEKGSFAKKRKTSVLQFISAVGKGDRCVRSDAPFPTLQNFESRREPTFNLLGNNARTNGGLLRKAKDLTNSSRTNPVPFVAPTVSKMEEISRNGRHENVITLDVTPRMVAYYEVHFIPRDESQEPSPLPYSKTLHDCVAIGLSNKYFNTGSRMPGWDIRSYGYHGDDGGIFHSNGNMVRSFGPTFGVGDTVGCGIDYVNHGIFFTLNGIFLGYGWTGINLSKPYYPTIGIDTRHPIEFNFGSRPFAFDMNEITTQHVDIVEDALRDIPKLFGR